MSKRRRKKGGAPKKFDNGYEKANRFYGLRLKREESYIKERYKRLAEQQGMVIGDYVKKVLKDHVNQNFDDIELKDLEMIFEELKQILLPLKYAKNEIYGLHPGIVIKAIFEADNQFFSQYSDLDKKILYSIWGKFLFENNILSYGFLISEITRDFLNNFVKLGEVSFKFLRIFQIKLKLETDINFKEDIEHSKKKISKELSKKGYNKAEIVESISRFEKASNIPEKPIFPIIKLIKKLSIGIEELKTLKLMYAHSLHKCVFLQIYNLWRNIGLSRTLINLYLKNIEIVRGLEDYVASYKQKEGIFLQETELDSEILEIKAEFDLFMNRFEKGLKKKDIDLWKSFLDPF